MKAVPWTDTLVLWEDWGEKEIESGSVRLSTYVDCNIDF
jgi:hypothetical protein